MGWLSILLLIVAIVCLIIGLLLSGSGSTTGLTALAGQDLELFKKTKDRGFIKLLQMVMFVLMFIMFGLAIIGSVLGIY